MLDLSGEMMVKVGWEKWKCAPNVQLVMVDSTMDSRHTSSHSSSSAATEERASLCMIGWWESSPAIENIWDIPLLLVGTATG